jgi:hypothetical protein
MPDLLRVDEALGRQLRETAETDERPIHCQIRFLIRLGLKLRRVLTVQSESVNFRRLRSGAR